MSIQQAYLSQIAAAIQEKEGSSIPIKASDFAERIRAIPMYGGVNYAIPLVVTVDPGTTVTAVHGEKTVTASSGVDGMAVLILTEPGVWKVTAALGDKEKSTEIEVVEGYSTEFTLSSRLPGGYTEVEYIESSNTQYVDTSVIPNATTILDMDFYIPQIPSNGVMCPFGTYKKIYSNSYNFFRTYISTTGRIQYCLGYNQISGPITQPGRHKIRLDALTHVGVYDDETTIITGNFEYKNLYSVVLFASNDDGSVQQFCTMNLYSCQIYGGSDRILVRDFVPCINPTGEVGLFDLVEEKFFANAGTGTFIAGPTV